eukprot:TRINITY_DN242_c0_g1_i10.p1 TRINITY_DN242_c0_g1~~TRINITY_DN242_c0_g1_i10.p1  ORF type:complete len:135 (-),score=19.79 TRINITY_DN242_c0_g1_i10:687-1091(-)
MPFHPVTFFSYYLFSPCSCIIQNCQVSIRATCCQRWFDCPDCHKESSDHELAKSAELILACKKCKKVFRKNMAEYDETDEYCPGCDNHYVIEAKTPQEPQLMIGLEGDASMIRDDRDRSKNRKGPGVGMNAFGY